MCFLAGDGSMSGEERREAAIEECRQANGHLLAIETQEERNFITEIYHSILGNIAIQFVD